MDISTPYGELVKVFLSTHKYQEADVNGAHFHYLLCGKGSTTLVLLVGGMGLSYMYMPYIKALESDYRILTFDYPYECTNNAKLADGISALLRYLNIEKGIFIGSSYGGYVAQIFARKYKYQTAGICLFSTAGLSEKTISQLKDRYEKIAPKLFWVLKHVPYSWLKPSMIRMCMRHAENVSKEEYAYIKNMFRYIYIDYTRELDIHMTELLFDLGNQMPCAADEFAYLKDRVLLILPENDDSFTPEMQKDLTDLMPECTIVEGIDSGHISTMIEVDRYVDEIKRFVGKEPDNG